MASATRNDDLPESPQKKRKLKHPRTSKACEFCRRRKVRCSGTHPCEYCRTEGVRCEYGDDLIRPSGVKADTNAVRSSPPNPIASTAAAPNAPESDSTDGPAPAHIPEQHMEAASGVALLYLSQPDDSHLDPIAPAVLASYGDYVPSLSNEEADFELPKDDVLQDLLDQYFRFAMPTYRCLHQPSVEQWASDLSSGNETLSIPQTACVLLACAQALLFTESGNRYGSEPDIRMRRSQQLYQKAKRLLNKESGPATTASVQARIVLCLYLLSTYRLTECRYTFGNTITILTSLGLQRRSSTPIRLGLIEIESRRRTFWCAYVLDGYLSVMLGRPRLFRDQDIDQEYPRNFDDHDMASDEAPDTIPLHGNLEAFTAHAELAKLMGYNNDNLYPPNDLAEEQILIRTSEMLEAIRKWRDSLPVFLSPREKTLAGRKTFERQNTVIKLAHAHLTILATRRCLVNDLDVIQHGQQLAYESYSLPAREECMSSISTILTVTRDLLERGTLYQAFWFTQYVAIVAISTLYVLVLQHLRTVSSSLEGRPQAFDGESLLNGAKTVQTHLAALAPENSQVGHHFKLLGMLQTKVNRELASVQSRRSEPAASNTNLVPHTASSSDSWRPPDLIKPTSGSMKARNTATILDEQRGPDPTQHDMLSNPLELLQETSTDDRMDLNPQFLGPGESNTDATFESLMNCGWEGLDTIGFDLSDEWLNLQSLAG